MFVVFASLFLSSRTRLASIPLYSSYHHTVGLSVCSKARLHSSILYSLFVNFIHVIAHACVRLTPLHRLLTCSGAEHDDYVVVREIHDHVTKRSDVALPDMLRVEFQRDGKTVRLDLERNKRVNVNVPVTFAGSDKRELVPDLNVRWQHFLALSLLS